MYVVCVCVNEKRRHANSFGLVFVGSHYHMKGDRNCPHSIEPVRTIFALLSISFPSTMYNLLPVTFIFGMLPLYI